MSALFVSSSESSVSEGLVWSLHSFPDDGGSSNEGSVGGFILYVEILQSASLATEMC